MTENGAVDLVSKFPDVDPFLLQKWERIFTMFFDRNLSHNVDWGDFYLVVRRCRDVYGAESTQIGYARKSMEALWQGLCKAADADRDKLISLEEWVGLLREVSKKKDDHPKWLDDYQSFMFKLFDVSSDGVLDMAEYADGMSLYGFTYRECVEAYKKFAVDDKGNHLDRVTPQQWKEMFIQLFFSTNHDVSGNHLFGKVAEI